MLQYHNTLGFIDMDNGNLSKLTERISGPTSKAWDVGDLASRRMLKGEEIIHLGVGDPDLDTPKPIRDALFAAIDSGKTHYAPLAGEMHLREAIAEQAEGLYGGKISPNNVVICNGAQGALYLTFQCITDADDEVIVLEPYYSPYPAVVTANGAKMVNVQLKREDDYRLNVADIKAAVTDKTKAMLINSPSNPAGTVFEASTVAELAQFCKEKNIWLVTDEVYWSMCFDGEHVSAYSNQDCRDHIVVVNSLSKSHAMTGWRLGWTIGPDHFADALTALMQAAQFGINQFVQNAAVVAIKNKECIGEFNAHFKSRRNVFCKGLRKSNHLSFATPRGGMFVLLDISATGVDGKEFAERLLDDERVAVVPGYGFGEAAENTVRIGYLCDELRLSEAAARIVRFTEKLMSEKA
jgi:arginine:pyruvate transaminase